MTSLNAGLSISRGRSPAVVADITTAESHGVDAVWSGGGGAVADTLTIYAAAALQTSTVTLGTSIIPTYLRHPVVMASEALAIEGLAPGRLRLGIGPSHVPEIEGNFGIPMGKPLHHLREYLTILRGLLWEGPIDFDGEYLHAHHALAADTAPPKTPLLISALRKNAFRLAGEASDGAITWVCPVQYLVSTALPAMQAGADTAGRPRPPLVAHVPVAVSADRAAARDAVRATFPVYPRLPFYQGMFADAGFPVTTGQTMTDDLVDNLAVSGTPEQIRRRLDDIRSEGIDELMISQVVVHDSASELASLYEILT